MTSTEIKQAAAAWARQEKARVQRELDEPFPEHGIHSHCLTLANRCRNSKMSTDEAVEHIYELSAVDLRRPLQRNEVENAVARAYETSASGNGRRASTTAKVTATYDPGLWQRLPDIKPLSVRRLVAASPYRWGDSEPHTAEVIDNLFEAHRVNHWICAGKTTYDFHTMLRWEWHKQPAAWQLHNLQFIVSSPPISKMELTQKDELSEHAVIAQFPKRRFTVVEFDRERNNDVQATILLWIARQWHLKLVVDSAGKSLHGWFDTSGTDENTMLTAFNQLVRLGADERIYTIGQFVRMPDGLRDGKLRQSILYYDRSY
jgi:hypothetical protein